MIILRTYKEFWIWNIFYTILDTTLICCFYFFLQTIFPTIVLLPILIINGFTNYSFLSQSIFPFRIICSLIGFFLSGFTLILLDYVLKVQNINFLNIIYITTSAFFISILIKMLLSISFCFSKNSNILFCGTEINCVAFDNFAKISIPTKYIGSICSDKNYKYNNILCSMNNIRLQINSLIRTGIKVKKIIVDHYDNYINLLQILQQDYTSLDIKCMEINNLYNYFIEKYNNKIALKNPSSTLFSGSSVLIISNNLDIIASFMNISKVLEVNKFFIVSDNPEIIGKYKGIWVSYLFSDEIILNIHREYGFDIIFDGYLTNINNFHLYRKIASSIISVANRQRVLISLCPQNVILEDFIVSKSKELIWQQYYCQFSNVLALRIGDIYQYNYTENQKIISIEKESFILDSDSIVNLIWNSMELIIRYSGENYNIISYVNQKKYNVINLLLLLSQLHNQAIQYQVIPFLSNISDHKENLTPEIVLHQINLKNKDLVNIIISNQAIDLNSLSQELFM